MTIQDIPFKWPETLPLFSTIVIGRLETPETIYRVELGISEKIAQAIIEHAHDESDSALREFTSDATRFASRERYREWYENGRTPFVLVDEKNNILAALIWFGKKTSPMPLPPLATGESYSVAFRSYPPYRGKGLMKPFGSFVFQIYGARVPKNTLWLSVHERNVPAQGLYRALGFKEYARKEDRVLMTHD